MRKKLCFDLDNVLCKTINKTYSKSKPIKNAIRLVNSLHAAGHEIIIFTARGMGRFDGKKKLVEKEYKKLTLKQLKSWNLKYNKLIFGKPSYDLFVDDKAYGFKKSWFVNYLKYLNKIK
jgi:histidinol phosphatase-like enzyme